MSVEDDPAGARLTSLSVVCVSAGGVNSPKVRDGDVRIFVALFSYEPATMSPNPDAAEEELPFSEGQIIKVRPRRAHVHAVLLTSTLMGWRQMQIS